MKTELIEYHRRQIFRESEMSRESYDCPIVAMMHAEKAAFHGRALAWLGRLDEGLSASASAETRIQRENLERLNRQVNG